MSLTNGISSYAKLTANQAVAASVVPVILGANTTGNSFSVAVNAGSKWRFKLRLVFSVGATGGLRFQWVVPAAPTLFSSTTVIYDTVTSAVITPTPQTSSAAITNALAVAGTHFADLTCYVENSVAGTISFQFACNTAANAITAFAGSIMEVELT